MATARALLIVVVAFLGLAGSVRPDETAVAREALLEECLALAERLERDEMPYRMSSPNRPPSDELAPTISLLRALVDERPGDAGL